MNGPFDLTSTQLFHQKLWAYLIRPQLSVDKQRSQNNNMEKKHIAIISLLVAIGTGIGGYYVANAYIQNVMVELAGLALALAVGIVAINIFLENKSRQAAVKSLFMLIQVKIRDFHNHWMNLVWSQFGRDRWGKIGKEYLAAGGKPEALALETRRGIYSLVKDNSTLMERLESLDEGMVELSRLGGWSLDAKLLQHCLDFRRSVVSLKGVTFDDSDTALTNVAEHILDSDIRSGLARARLLKLAGISEEN